MLRVCRRANTPLASLSSMSRGRLTTDRAVALSPAAVAYTLVRAAMPSRSVSRLLIRGRRTVWITGGCSHQLTTNDIGAMGGFSSSARSLSEGDLAFLARGQRTLRARRRCNKLRRYGTKTNPQMGDLHFQIEASICFARRGHRQGCRGIWTER
jgi:hypothetical protein